jgi:DNA-binding transcriptional regulator YiaG
MTPEELVKARNRLKMRQDQLAEALGVTQGALSRWESGQRRIPEMAARLIKRLIADQQRKG